MCLPRVYLVIGDNYVVQNFSNNLTLLITTCYIISSILFDGKHFEKDSCMGGINKIQE